MDKTRPGNKSKYDLPEFFNGLPIGEIVRAVHGIQYGQVQIIIQDSRVIQIDKTEKKRILIKEDPDFTI